MAYPVPTGSVMEVSFKGTNDGQLWLTYFHYYFDNPGEVDPLSSDVVNPAFIDWFLNESNMPGDFAGCLSTNVNFESITFQWVHPIRAGRLVYPATDYTPGVGGAALPSCVAGAITRRAEGVGPRNHGTIHMPGVPAAYNEDGELSEAGLIQYGIFAGRQTAWVSGGVDSWRMLQVIFNRDDPGASPYVNSANPEGTLRTARRRVVGRGK